MSEKPELIFEDPPPAPPRKTAVVLWLDALRAYPNRWAKRSYGKTGAFAAKTNYAKRFPDFEFEARENALYARYKGRPVR